MQLVLATLFCMEILFLSFDLQQLKPIKENWSLDWELGNCAMKLRDEKCKELNSSILKYVGDMNSDVLCHSSVIIS